MYLFWKYDIGKQICWAFDSQEPEKELEKFNIGWNFLDFINLDLTGYDNYRKRLCNIIDEALDSDKDVTEYALAKIPDLKLYYEELKELDLLDNKGITFLSESLCKGLDNIQMYPNQNIVCDNNFIWDTDIYNDIDDDYSIFDDGGLLDLLSLQNQYKLIAYWCFDYSSDNSLSSLSSAERLMIYIRLYKATWLEGYGITETVTISEPNQEQNKLSESELSEFCPKMNNSKNVLSKIKNSNIKIVTGYAFHTTEEGLLCELLKMIEANIQFRRCKNCGDFFIITNSHNATCCNKIYKDTKLTCQQIYANKVYNKKINNNPIIKEFKKTYKRKYAQVSNMKLTQEEFRIWLDKATIKRNEAAEMYTKNPDDQIVQEFKRYLGNK